MQFLRLSRVVAIAAPLVHVQRFVDAVCVLVSSHTNVALNLPALCVVIRVRQREQLIVFIARQRIVSVV